MKIEKLKSGSYRIRKTYQGKTYTIVVPYKPTQKECLRLMADEMDKAQTEKKRMTFKTAAEKYIEIKTNVISPSTVREYEGIIKRLSKDFNSTLISDITAETVQKEINCLAKDKAPKTVSNYHGFITAVLKMYAPNTILNTTLPQKHKIEPYIPTDEDVKRILDHAKGSMFEIPIALACFGMRRSEICALTMDDIEGNIIHINKALVQNSDKKWIVKTTKTVESTRDIWVPDEIIEMINQHGAIYNGSPNSITCYLAKVQKKLGIPHFGLHKLRHYYASTSTSLGVPNIYIMKSGGWKSDNVLKTVYQHAIKDKKLEMQQFTGEYLKEVMF